MSTALEINGVSFLSIKEAATSVSYSKDYVSRLAREKKIVATQVGRQWYVDPVSLRSFAEMASLEQEVRKQQLSLERRKEQSVKRDAKAVKSSVSSRLNKRMERARVAATFVLLLGMSLGVFGYIYNDSSLIASLVKVDGTVALINRDIKKGEEDSLPLPVPQKEPVAVYSTVIEKTDFENTSEVTSIKAGDVSGIFLFNKNASGTINQEDEEVVAEIFSDEVAVKFTSESGGVVVYEAAPGEKRELPFVAVPGELEQASSTEIF